MLFEITVKSSAEARFDGSVELGVKDALASVGLGVQYDEGGTGFAEDPETAADNHFGIEVAGESEARNAALVVANRMKRPVSFYRYGDGVDISTTPHMVVEPGDLPT